MNQHELARRSDSETRIIRPLSQSSVQIPLALEEEIFASLTLALSALDPQTALAHLNNARNFLFASAKVVNVSREGKFSFSLVEKTVGPPILEEQRRLSEEQRRFSEEQR